MSNNNDKSMGHAAAMEGMKAAPALGVTTATVFGYPIDKLVAYATLVYLILQIVYLLYRFYLLRKSSNAKRDTAED